LRAIQITAYGAPVALKDIAIRLPGEGEVRVRIAACGVNFADLLMTEGRYQERPPLPMTLGMELAGTVDAVGAGVERPKVGDRVAVFAASGGMAEYGCFPAQSCILLPPDMPLTDAAAFQIAYGTSHLALDHRGRLQPGETLLVLGAAGGVGLTAVEIGKRMGARVIACARGAEKLVLARAKGADHLIDSQSEDISQVVRDLGGADVVFDPVGGAQFKSALRACRPEARVLTIGFASGTVPQIPANILLVKNVSVIGIYWGGYLQFAPQVLTGSLKTLFQWYEAGELRPHISHVLPLEQAAEALDLLRRRVSTGKVVLTP